MKPLNIRFRARSKRDGKIVTGFYCRHDYGRNAMWKDSEPFSTHDIWRNSPKGWVEIDPNTLEVFEITEPESLFDEIIAMEAE